ncbi:MAG: ABC transporter ATP-binding protein/permease [Mollicutes bacterium]|nr:ABC transporter ATP-binding protein/permease [Mollicutes bacterium]
MIKAFKHLGWFFKENWWRYLICGILLLIVSIFPVIPGKVLGLAIDEIAMGTLTSNKLVYYIIGLFFIPLTVYIVNIFYHYMINELGHTLSFQLREKYLSHLFDMDAQIFEEYTKGDLIARMTNDLQNLTILATSFLQNIVYYIALICSAVTMMIIINPILTVASVAFMPFAIFILNYLRKKKRAYYKIHHEIYANMTESVLESIESVKVVRAYGEEEEDFKRTKVAIDADVNSWWKILKFESMFTPMFELTYAIAYFIAISLGCYMVVYSKITPGSLVTFLLYVAMLYNPLIGLSNILNNISNILIADGRFYEIMDRAPKVVNEESPLSVMNFKKIEFKDVSFKYPFDDFSVLKNINLTINSGETIGIVGPTGSGKSTLIRQLLREFNTTGGEVLIDGVNINHYKIEDVRSLVGYVPQNNILFRRSIDDNILIGNPLASSAELNAALYVSDFKKDLQMLPEGEHTQVSELGGSLSGGQRQRLSIARALVKNPEILILDDSLSAVDALTEANIIEKLRETRKDKTNIIVAHRFSAIAKADKIVVMENGSISCIGTHKELINYDNWYKNQYLRQIKGEIYD